MKKKLFIIGAVALTGLAAGIYSCERDDDVSREISVNQIITRAQRFFENEVGSPSLPDTYYKAGEDTETRAAGISSTLAGAIEPDWSNARVFNSGQTIVTEVPAIFIRPVIYSVTIKERGKSDNHSKQVPHTRIRIVETRGEADSVYCFVVTMLPDKSYKNDPWQLAADPEGSKFTGITLYSLPDGTPAWGWRYKNGKGTHTLRFDEAYRDQTDTETTFFIGINPGAMTRGVNDINIIDPVDVIGTPGKKGQDHEKIFPDIDGGNSGDDRSGNGSGGAGGGGGGGGGGGPSAPKAKKLFRNNNLTETDWKALEDMINKIMADCMGGKLYNSLYNEMEGGKLDFRFGNNPVIAGGFDVNSQSITINSRDSGTLFHEMFHAYQSYQESLTSYNNSSANREIEAYIAEYRLSGKIESSDYRGNLIFLSDQYISPKGAQVVPSDELSYPFNDVYRNTIDLIKAQYARFGKNLQFDQNRTFNQNFKNLRYLSNGC